MSRYRIEALQASHALEAFACGEEPLNRFLVRFALANQRARASRTYVALAAAEIAGIRSLAVHAKDEQARGFYEHFGFRPSPTDPLHLFVLLKDLQGIAGG